MTPADPLAGLAAGSGRYYLARLARPEHRAASAAALRFAAELEHSVARCNDPGATRLKLDWWRKELAQAAPSHHPLARQLAPLADDPAGLAALRAMLDAAEADVLRQRPTTCDAFVAHCQQAGRLAELLCLAAATPCDPGPLGSYAVAVNRIQRLGRALLRGHNPLPMDLDLPSDPRQWSPAALADACQALLTPLRESAELALADRAAASRPARRWAALARARHRLLAREGYPVRDRFVDITPIARLWTAWRVR